MPEYDAFGREVGEDTLASWRSGSEGAPPRPAPAPPAPATVSAGDPLRSPPEMPARGRVRSRPTRRGPRIRLRWIVLLMAGWFGLTVFADVADRVGEGVRDIRIPAPSVTDPEPLQSQPAGLGGGSLLRAAAFERALGDLRGRGIGRVQSLRLAPERLDSTLLTRRGTLVTVQLRSGGELRRLAESGTGFGGLGTIPYAELRPGAPERLVRAAAERLGRPASRIDYLVATYTTGELSWGAHFKGGAIFRGDARGRILRRMS